MCVSGARSQRWLFFFFCLFVFLSRLIHFETEFIHFKQEMTVSVPGHISACLESSLPNSLCPLLRRKTSRWLQILDLSV